MTYKDDPRTERDKTCFTKTLVDYHRVAIPLTLLVLPRVKEWITAHRVDVRDLQYRTEALVYNNHPWEAAVSTSHNLRADCHWRTLVPPNAALVSMQWLSAVQALMIAVVALKQPAIEC